MFSKTYYEFRNIFLTTWNANGIINVVDNISRQENTQIISLLFLVLQTSKGNAKVLPARDISVTRDMPL